jgi:hypothetical protein
VPLAAGVFAIEELNASIKFSGLDLKLSVHISIFFSRAELSERQSCFSRF